jgi:peptidoglycan/xylan/chitin deacetylase (PgdA/CDA1 family)
MLRHNISLLLRKIDEILGSIIVLTIGEKPGLISVLFHSLFLNKKQINQNIIDPQQRITIDLFEEIIRYFVNHNYQFVSPLDLEKGLFDGKNILLSFDDGYYNNTLALPILKKYQIPAVFFISTNHVKYGKCFWWDVLYREGKRKVWSEIDLVSTRNNLKNKHFKEIEQYLKQTFGENALIPTEDVDRPFTPTELSKFSKHPYVHIGNHTTDHTILTLYSADEIRQQIMGAQSYLSNIVGYKPIIIAYPNGNYSHEVLREARKCGIKVGLSVDNHKDYLPIDLTYSGIMKLGRFAVRADKSMSSQCAMLRYDNNISIKETLKRIMDCV